MINNAKQVELGKAEKNKYEVNERIFITIKLSEKL